MTNILIGLFFIFFDLTVNITELFEVDFELGIYDMVVSVVPSFVGYILIFIGLNSMRGKTKNFIYAQWAAGILILIDLIRWTCVSLGLLGDDELIFQIVIYVGMSVMLYFIAVGIKYIADSAQVKLNQKSMMIHTVTLIATHFVMYLFSNNLLVSGLYGTAALLAIFVILINLLYIGAFYRMSKKYKKALLQ